MNDDIQLIFKKLSKIEQQITTLQKHLKDDGLAGKWQTTEQAAKRLGVSEATIRRNAHQLRGVRHGKNGNWRFKPEYLDLNQHKII